MPPGAEHFLRPACDSAAFGFFFTGSKGWNLSSIRPHYLGSPVQTGVSLAERKQAQRPEVMFNLCWILWFFFKSTFIWDILWSAGRLQTTNKTNVKYCLRLNWLSPQKSKAPPLESHDTISVSIALFFFHRAPNTWIFWPHTLASNFRWVNSSKVKIFCRFCTVCFGIWIQYLESQQLEFTFF